MMKNKTIIVLLTFALSALPVLLPGQSTEYSLRSSVDLEWKIAKKLKLEVSPEFRYNPGSAESSVHLQAGLNYRLASWLSLGGYYRQNGAKVSGTETTGGESFDLSNRFAFDANTKVSLKRFTPKIRVRFSNFTDFDSQTDDQSNYLRYRFGLDYNVKGIKLTPFASVEMYHKLSSGLISKSRYTIGAEYDFNKTTSLSAGYSYARKYKAVIDCHIFELTCKIKF